MSAIGDLLINLGQKLPETLRKRQEEADAQARQDDQDQAQAEKDRLSALVTNAQLGEITRKNSAEDAATQRATQARTAVGDTLSKISSGDFRNPDTQIEDPELVKEQAITAATAPNSPYGNAPVPALFNGPAAPSAQAAMTANRDTLDTVGLGGLAKAKTDIQNRSPAQFFRGQTGAYSDQPVQKGVMSDFEKQDELKQKADETAAQRIADQTQHDKDLQTTFQNQKTLKGMEIQGQKDVADLKNKGGDASDIQPGSGEDKIADQLASGKITFDQMIKIYPGFSKNATKREAILELATQKNPNFNPAQQMQEYKWSNNPGAIKTIAAANNAMSNIDKVVEVSDLWKRSGSPAMNNLLKETQFQLGDRNVSNIKELQTAVGDEVAGVLGYGTSSDLKTKLGIDLMDPNVSAENFQSNMKILKHLLQNRAKTMAAPMGQYGDRPGITPVINDGSTTAGGTSKTSSGNRFTWQ